MARALETLRLEPWPGATLVVDHLDGEPPGYLFLHGMSATRAGEKSSVLLAHARRRGRAFAAFDFRGHGESSGRLEDMTLSKLIEDGQAVLHRLGRAILVGSSMGGLVAAWLAAREPELVAGLTLLAPAFGFLPRLTGQATRMQEGRWSRPELTPEFVADARGYDEGSLPGLLPMRILIVHGELDDVVPVSNSREFQERIAHEGKELWIVPGGDHRLNGPMEEICGRMDEVLG